MKWEEQLNKLAKWRAVFAGWQLGTRTREDAESEAVRDHREVTILLRCEVNALASLLLKRGAFTENEWLDQLSEEAEHLDKQYERCFPGFISTLHGMDIDVAKARETTKNWAP